MDIIQQMNMAMSYIEENLEKEIDIQQVSRLACCSEYHFRRMFSYITGMSLGEYIRNRKLSIAAILLKNKKNKIIDVAFRLGYESPDSFSKAFLSFHGITPSIARQHDSKTKVCTPIVFQFNVKGGNKMNYRIVEKEAFNIIGVSGKIPLIYNGPNPYTANVWKKLKQEDILVLIGYSKLEPKGMLSAYANYAEKREEGTEVDLIVGVAADKSFKPYNDRFEIIPVEASKWAVFTTIGPFPSETQKTWARIGTEWFPTSGYEHTGGPEISWYETYEFGKPDFKSEIWIPIRKLHK